MSLFELAVTDRPVEHSRFARAWSHWPRWTAWGAMFWSATYALAQRLDGDLQVHG